MAGHIAVSYLLFSASHVYKDVSTRKREVDEMETALTRLQENKSDVGSTGIRNGDFVAIDPAPDYGKRALSNPAFWMTKLLCAPRMGVLQQRREHSITPAYDLFSDEHMIYLVMACHTYLDRISE